LPDYRLRIQAEYNAIESLLAALPALPLSAASALELAGIGALLYNFYNGIENVLKQLFQARTIPIPQGESWHKDLLLSAGDRQMLSAALVKDLRRYLAFRHFFGHGYALNLLPERIEPLAKDAASVFSRFKEEIEKAMS